MGGGLGNLEQMGKCIVNPSGVSFKGGETKDAKPPGVGGGHGGGGGEGLLVTVFLFSANDFFFGGSFSEALLEGIFG